MNLIANTGIQLYTKQVEINLNNSFKMYFHEWFDVEDEQLKLEIAHNFSEDAVWVKKHDLLLLGYLTNGKVGRMENEGFKTYKWEEIKNDFYTEGKQLINPMETENGESDCFQMSLNSCRWEKFENKWFPLPFFELNSNDKSAFGPTNWCRFKLIPSAIIGNVKKYNLLLAFDTRTSYEQEDFEDEDLNEMPVFANTFDMSKDFALCNNEFSLVDFCSKSRNCEWVDEYVLHNFHNVKKIDDLKMRKPKLSYLAQYIYIIKFIQQLNVLPKITLFSDSKEAFGNVDLIVDIGNSRTCAVLFDDSDFTKVESLELQNFSVALTNDKLTKHKDAFDMRLAFRAADFGGSLIEGSSQFIFPSMVRMGVEANELIHMATNLNTGVEKVTTFSSPKRYLWDNKPQQKEWEFITLNGEQRKSIWIKGISEQLNSDGSLNTDGSGGTVTHYSRKALMTFGFLEILAQAKMQINSYEFRHKWGNENSPRKIGRIIITCPTAMSRIEQIALRKCAEDSAIILDRFCEGTYYKEIDERKARLQTKVIPSVKNLLNNQEHSEWICDEATSAQFVYLYAEIRERYLKKCKEYFDFYGKARKDLNDYNKKSLTIGSVDIGAGTTDVMIAAYKYNDDAEQCILTPVPLFWESFYIAGDDLLKELIRQLVVEGEYAAIYNQLKKLGNTDKIPSLIADFFGIDNARKSVQDRQIRSEFNLQVSVPVVLHFLELLKENKIEKATLTFDDIFSTNKPTERVLAHFSKHFGFAVDALQWNFDKEIISKIVERTFDALAGKISTVLSYYGCDIVLLSGRPTSLKPLSDLFLKYYAVSPNRLITLSNYRVGTWYPFQNGKGYFEDAKSIVVVGAMIGNFASTRGSLNGFSLNLSELNKTLLPTTEFFTKSERDSQPFITPQINSANIEVSQLPLKIWCRQLNTVSYPTRPIYLLEFNQDKIEKKIISMSDLTDVRQIKDAVNNEIERVKNLSPFIFCIERENYLEDKETLRIVSVEDRNHENLPLTYFTLQIQSMSEKENYWLDSGEFTNLNTTHN